MGARCHRCGVPRAPHGRALSGREDLLVGLLETAVMMEADNLSRMAWRDVQGFASAAASTIGSHGDDLQFGGKHCAPTFAALARGLAALSFAPGGVTFLGAHWCARHPESSSIEGQYAAREVA